MFRSARSLLVFAGVLGLVIGASTVRADLVGYWKSDEASGTTVADSSGNSYNGAIVGALDHVAGKFGGALSYSTTPTGTDYVEVPSSTKLNSVWNTTGFTVSLWANGASSSGAQIFSKYRSLPTFDGMYLYQEGWGVYKAAPNAGAIPVSTGSYADSTWHNVVVRYDPATNNLSSYNNGALVETVAAPTAGVSNAAAVVNWFAPSGAPSYVFQGKMDDIAMFDAALTGNQSKSIYNVGNSALGYSMADMSKLFTLYANASGNTTTSDGKLWEYSASGLSGTPGAFVDSGSMYSVIFSDAGTAGVWTTMVPEPGTLALLATGLIGLLAYAWRKRK